jgi:hypothetical protein
MSQGGRNRKQEKEQRRMRKRGLFYGPGKGGGMIRRGGEWKRA